MDHRFLMAPWGNTLYKCRVRLRASTSEHAHQTLSQANRIKINAPESTLLTVLEDPVAQLFPRGVSRSI